MPKLKAARAVGLDDIMSSAFVDDGSLLGPALKGHLAIQALLVELIQIRIPGDSAWELNFPAQTKKAVELGLLPTHLKLGLDSFNRFRNAFAHVFGHQVPVEDVHALARELEGYGVDFSDSVGNRPLKDAVSDYSGDLGLLQEVLWCLCFEVAFALMQAGGRDLFSDG
ncbi:hypothetical protein [Caulobacter sp. FWC2]|uniref:hypothetical protein n=1 Tax=Caulobacter sp. FWC2 TaxID=69664 RepID=UPI000C1578B7|nr:hypothetical protein [Caulobacter sp. FWC2]PIB90501.1 hypothetical protein CSW62_02310 [Caulobacter sp. FWC2]